MTKLEQDSQILQSLIDESKKIVFFGGAGVATESGIPDFRSQDGLYHQKYKYPPETIISAPFFENNPEEFYRFYKEKRLLLDKKPNACHYFLAKLEAFIRGRVAKKSLNFMDRFTGTIAGIVEDSVPGSL